MNDLTTRGGWREYVVERLYRYVEGYFQRSGGTEFPTVRQCARALGWRQARVLEAVEEHELLFTSDYFTEEYAAGTLPDGDLFVESLEGES